MDYKPRYTQPFTLAEARLLDVETITEEIARLQNSLQRLDETQKMLREHVDSIQPEVDPEISKAIQENETVIGSQSERISMLKMALADRGVTGSHYDLAPPVSRVVGSSGAGAPAEPHGEENGGVDL
ncbi:hypothetical protein DFH07DRAFT_811006 [Mycena maculata]|uniref:Uncharacterized protein n=1 Tax=Mycena maculata TaxID=230809 RepID=A0AAD7JHL3_9AGAR|nr:hypothetical protein DFH07DRAFT_811006 [Mycena maculata]